jgi:hypothetical protein
MKILAMRLSLMGVLLCSVAMGQGTTATVSGVVTDPSGGVVPGATVTLTNDATKVTRDTVTNGRGEYTVPSLQPATYSILISAPGMQSQERHGVLLQLGQEARLDFQLTVGSTTTTVTVTGSSAPILNTENATIASDVQDQTLTQTPLNARVFWNMVLLQPGVNLSTGGNSDRGGMIISGQPETANNWVVDGINDIDYSTAAPGYRPSVDAIQEFKVYTGNYDAEFGRNAGGQVVVVTKSGTNRFHGTVYEFLRNQDLDANNYFSKNRPAYKRNQFGGTFSGPIQKNKTFFFFAYEGERLINQQVSLSTVPTSAEVNGDFSGLPSSVVLKTPAGYPANAIVHNVINPSALTPAEYQSYVVGRALLGIYPSPTTATPAGSAPSLNYLFNANATESLDQENLKLDHTFSDRNSAFVSLNYLRDPQLSYFTVDPECGEVTIPGFGCFYLVTAQLYGIGWTHSFSPTVVNDFHLGYSRFVAPRPSSPQYEGNFFNQTYNIPAFDNPGPTIFGPPNVSITGYNSYGMFAVVPNFRDENTFDVSDSVYWSFGKHSFKAGGESIRLQNNATVTNYPRGNFGFTSSSTGPTTGYALADAVLGLPATAEQDPTAPPNEFRDTIFGLYVEDSYKVMRRLTVNYGLRWDETTPIADNFNGLTNFDTASGTPYLINSPGHRGSSYNPDHHDFGPRLGVVYQLSDKTTLRAGAGTYFNAPAGSNSFLNLIFYYPARLASTFTSTPTNPLSLPNPFVGGNALTLAGIEPKYQSGILNSWGMDVQREIAPNLLFDLGYYGNRATHAQTNLDINQPAPSTLPAASVQATAPYPNYSVINYLESAGISTYESLQVKLDKRYSNGLFFTVAYTFAKSLDDISGTVQNNYDLKANYGPSANDVRHRFVFNPVYELPIGRGKRFVNEGTFLPAILGGFQVSSIVTGQTGVPVTAYMSGNFSNANILNPNSDRPNVVGNPNSGPHTLDHWFNTAAFVAPAFGTFGNEGTDIIKGPGLWDWDFTLARDFALPHEASLQFRVETFNILNHPNFAPPGNIVNSPSFGEISSTNTNTLITPRQIQIGLKILF